jgi:hypothetical protein
LHGEAICGRVGPPESRGGFVPEEDDDAQAMERARRDAEEGKAPSTQAGEFVREEIHHARENNRVEVERCGSR